MVKAGELALDLQKGHVPPEHHKAGITCHERAESLSRAATSMRPECCDFTVEVPSVFDLFGILVSLLHTGLGAFSVVTQDAAQLH